MLRNEAYKQTDLLLPPLTADLTIDVPTAAATLIVVHTAWVVGQLRLTPTQKKYYLSICGNCNKNVKAGSCGEMRDVEFKCRVPLELTGEDKSLPIVLTSPDVERMTGITAIQLRDSHEFVVSFVKKYDINTLGSPGVPGIRYAAVKTYTVDAIKLAPTVTGLLMPGPQEAASTDDAQFFSANTKKQLSHIEGMNVSNKAETSTPPAKRSLDFMSMPTKDKGQIDEIMPCKQSADVNTSSDDPEKPPESPVKKGKEDKEKLN